MCLLSYFPPGTAPDPAALRVGARINSHGHGFAVVTPGHVIVGHGLDSEQIIEEFLRVRTRHRAGPALFHSRYATHGAIELTNCHPFRLGADARTVLAHNGVLPRRVRPRPYDRRSDTRIAAETYLARHPFGSIDTPRGRRGLESWLGAGKLVILTVDPSYRHNAYLFNESAGHWDGGIWYSNLGYRPNHSRWWPYLCDRCGAAALDRRGRYCGSCGWCFHCANAFPTCDCDRLTDHSTIMSGRSAGPDRALTPAPSETVLGVDASV